MFVSIPSIRKAVMSLSVVPLLAACAFAPGMRFDPQRPLDPADSTSVPKITPITPDLVRAGQEQAQAPHENVDVDQLLAKATPYRIGTGDILSIVVWDHPELVFPTQTYSIGSAYDVPSFGGTPNVPGYVVSTGGDIQFPYAGVIKVAGKTQNEVRDEITRAIARVVKDPQVTVRVLAYRSQRIYVDGEVKTPGQQSVDDVPMTLVEALNRAGGINVTTGDNSRIRLTRGGKQWMLSMPALMHQGIDPANILLRSGDIVRVEQREDSKVFVTGEVVRPSTVLPRNGKLTLSEALGEAGGVSPVSSDPRNVYVIRRVAQGEPQVYHLDAKSPVALALAEGFELQPKDVVYVDAGSLVRWSRVINLLVPTATPLIGAAAVAK
ncbi:polysaccharide biosynthesis/export family protein [Ralstonia solanacearum]|uniref:Multidrug MFS transporter n=1 Tax=Ralstonia solanacearum TaxID=305 RepID=A0AAD0SB17_RALSL|nr:polysaccharide biosynthesis/export family protein [Ralstonia solanacearum]AXV84061.1 multidrug MFS transporter [Ralstonia solanacearum]AXW55190.1 multidrug MFS transporter [Ralstonia solanacearum]